MGFRFRRTKKILPGVRVNLNKGSASVSFGPRGFKHTISTSGKHTTTVGIPDSGLSWTGTKGGKSPTKSVKSSPTTTTQPETLYSGPMSMAPTYATQNYIAEPQNTVSQKNWSATLIMAIFMGFLGIHRFYTGKIATGVLYLLTCGCFFVGWIVDIILIMENKFTDSTGNIIVKP